MGRALRAFIGETPMLRAGGALRAGIGGTPMVRAGRRWYGHLRMGMVSVPLIALACICIALGRGRIRRARREERGGFWRRLGSWLLVLLGFVLMILGVLFW